MRFFSGSADSLPIGKQTIENPDVLLGGSGGITDNQVIRLVL